MEYTHEFEAALEMISGYASPVDIESVPLGQASGRVLAEDFFAREDVPSFERSPYDGYALRASDCKNACVDHPAVLRVIEEIPAGKIPEKKLHEGTAAKIMTGAMLPEGADCVEMFERTDEAVSGVVRLFAPLSTGENVVRAGEDVRKGDIMARAGSVIDPGLAGSLAAQGVTEPLVYRRPIVGLISTGSEIVPADGTVPPGKIRNSNRYSLTAALRNDGCDVKWLGIAKDDAESITALIERALDSCDIVFLTGGVSVGEYDLTKDAMEAAGIKILVHGVGIKPGMACCYGAKEFQQKQRQDYKKEQGQACKQGDEQADNQYRSQACKQGDEQVDNQYRSQACKQGDEQVDEQDHLQSGKQLDDNIDEQDNEQGNEQVCKQGDEHADKKGYKLVIALSGNPASALTNYYSIARAAVKKLRGLPYSREIFEKELFDVRLAEDFNKKSKAARFLRGQLVIQEGQAKISLSQDQGNIVLSSTIGANMMAIVPAGSPPLKAGSVLKGFIL